MQQATQKQYLGIADNFVRTRLRGKQVTPKTITDELQKAAADYRPDYWRRLRRGLALQQRKQGYDKAADRIAATKNPLTGDKEGRAKTPKKQKRVKSINEADHGQLIAAVKAKGDHQLQAALYIARQLGCRPAEMPGIVVDGTTIRIKSAKARTDRGIDRTLEVPENIAKGIRASIDWLAREPGSQPMRQIQARLARLTKQLWPSRKHRISLYSYRHQLGSNLKASGRDPRHVAAIMGHLSTASVDRYGDRRSAKGGIGSHIRPSLDTINRVQVAPYPSPPSQQTQPQMGPGLGL